MKLSAKGLMFLQQQEGYSDAVYLDIDGNPTGGWGHLLSEEEKVKWPVGTVLSQGDWLQILDADVEIAEKGVSNQVSVPLSQNQFDALVDFVFNLGERNLEISTLLKDLNNGNYNAAAAQIPLWDHAGGKVVKDLETRRLDEQKLFLS